MQYLWQEFGRSERPYTNDDIRAALAEVTGNRRFADNFFNRYVYDSQLPDYASLLAQAGLLLQKSNEGQATLGPVSFEFEGRDAIIDSNTLIGTPLYDAGLDRGDRVIAIDRLRITSQNRWDSALDRYEPGDTATITYLQRGIERSTEIGFEEDPSVEVVTFESADRDLSDAQRQFRRAWLGAED